MKWIWMAAGAIAILVVVVLVVGWLMPVRHRASRQATFRAAPASVWELITNVDAFPAWRGDVKAVERLPDRDGRPVWVEEGSNGRITYVRRAGRGASPAGRPHRRRQSSFWWYLDLRDCVGARGQHVDDHRGRRNLQPALPCHVDGSCSGTTAPWPRTWRPPTSAWPAGNRLPTYASNFPLPTSNFRRQTSLQTSHVRLQTFSRWGTTQPAR